MPLPSAASSGTFSIGGNLARSPSRLRRDACHRRGDLGRAGRSRTTLPTLRQARDLGITFIETADSYGLFVSEDLNREARHPYDGLSSPPRVP